MTANRYFTPESQADTRGLTLVFAHSVGAHKEQWDATIEELFPLQDSREPHLRVHEAWSLDCMNHGDAALLNREELASNRKNGISAFEWSEAITAFLRSPQLKGKRVVLLSHCFAAPAIILSTKTIRPGQGVPCAIIMVEPFIMSLDVFNRHFEEFFTRLALRNASRQNKWPSREDAYRDGGIAFKTDPLQEFAWHHDIPSLDPSVEHLARIIHRIPAHIIWGTRVDVIVPQIARDALPWVPASVRVQGGHPENPAGVAKEICRVLDGMNISAGTEVTSRL
ncbi:Alpha beta-hydrolase [Mycena sanguinolenta]|uniref:Alpha beta-hydrolase n=1 Tax=Mycena sanguinolenta TaxID=230812 RepID=A0A8H6XHZ5_9AGAR|nr:Alpha beta-hydrolase [Mycena sanguinolenta]